MIGRILVGLLSAAAACASWAGRPHTSADTPVAMATVPDSIYADILPRDHALIPALDRAYSDLESAMAPYGCTSCHAPDLSTGGRRARTRHAMQLLDSRRAIEAMLEANMMPPETAEHGAGIADETARAVLLQRAKSFRALGDAAVASW